MAGGIPGIGFHDHCLYTAEAVTKVRLRRFPQHRQQALFIEHSPIHREIARIIAMMLEVVQGQMVLLGEKSADERVASILLASGLRIAKSHLNQIV